MENQVKITVARDPRTGRFTAVVDQPEPEQVEERTGPIKIVTDKLVPPSGVPSRKIISIEGVLKREELPSAYFLGDGPRIYKTEMGYIDLPSGYLVQNEVYNEDQFQSHLAKIREAGARLHEINSKIRELKKTWKGEETFLI